MISVKLMYHSTIEWWYGTVQLKQYTLTLKETMKDALKTAQGEKICINVCIRVTLSVISVTLKEALNDAGLFISEIWLNCSPQAYSIKIISDDLGNLSDLYLTPEIFYFRRLREGLKNLKYGFWLYFAGKTPLPPLPSMVPKIWIFICF